MAERILKLESKDADNTHIRAKTYDRHHENSVDSNSVSSLLLQRKADCACGGGCPNCQTKSNLPISHPSDASEIEADRIASQINSIDRINVLRVQKLFPLSL
jgi:hypothetical protein